MGERRGRCDDRRISCRARRDHRGGNRRGLVLADNWYPGWKAAIDGAPAEILVADHALRFIALPAGRHTIVFEFHPRTLAIGVAISLVTLAAAASVGARALITARRA